MATVTSKSPSDTRREFIIDLSGKGGLAQKFWGDSDQVTTTVNTRYFDDTSAYAEGFFNPWMRNGYTSPAVSTLGAMTISGGTTQLSALTSVVYDEINDDVYLGERNKNLFRADGLDDTSITLEHALAGTASTPKYTDLEIYQVNGVRTLFAAYQRSADTFTANAGTDVVTFSNFLPANNVALTLTSTGTLPGGLSAGTTYYTVASSGFTAQLSTSLGGSAVNITDAGTGVHTASGNMSDAFSKNLTSGSTTEGAFRQAVNPITLGASSNIMLRVADNGFMYIMDANAIHKFDGTLNGGSTGTISANVLLFPPYFNIVDALDYRGLMFIAVHQSSFDVTLAQTNFSNFNTSCGIYIWDRLSSIIQTRDYVPLLGVRAIKKLYISPDGFVRCLCIAANGLVQMRQYDGTSFSVIKELGLGAAPQYPDSLTTATSHTFWLGTDGTIYGHGKNNPEDKEILAKIGRVKATSSSFPQTTIAGGIVFYGAANAYGIGTGYRSDLQGLTISYDDSSVYTNVKFYPFDVGTINSNNQTALAGNIYTGLQFLPQLSTVHYLNLFMSAGSLTGTTTQATVRIYFNGSTTQWGSGKTITRDDIARGYKRIEINQSYVNSIQLKIEYATGVTLNDTYDFHPSYAVVNYSPTETKG